MFRKTFAGIVGDIALFAAPVEKYSARRERVIVLATGQFREAVENLSGCDVGELACESKMAIEEPLVVLHGAWAPAFLFLIDKKYLSSILQSIDLINLH